MIDSVGSAASSSATSSAATLGPGGNLGKDEFLKILVAQLRHQDPLNPMQGNEMAVQLAQFSSVEQLMNLNQAFADQAGLQNAIAQALNGTTAVGMIGRDVLALGDQVAVAGGKGSITAAVGGEGGQGVLRLYDSGGNLVGTQELGTVPAGRHSFELGAAFESLPDGNYTAELEITDAEGNAVDAETYLTVRIDGVRYTADGPVLMAGQFAIPFGAVVEVLAASQSTGAPEQGTPETES